MSTRRTAELELRRLRFSDLHSWGKRINGRAKFDLSGGVRMGFRNACCASFCSKHANSGLDLEISSRGKKTSLAHLSPSIPQSVIDFAACTLTLVEDNDFIIDLEISCGCDVSLAGEYTGNLVVT